MQRYESFENPLAGQSFESQDDDQVSSGSVKFGSALYDFTAGGDDEVNTFKLSFRWFSSANLCCEYFTEFAVPILLMA